MTRSEQCGTPSAANWPRISAHSARVRGETSWSETTNARFPAAGGEMGGDAGFTDADRRKEAPPHPSRLRRGLHRARRGNLLRRDAPVRCPISAALCRQPQPRTPVSFCLGRAHRTARTPTQTPHRSTPEACRKLAGGKAQRHPRSPPPQNPGTPEEVREINPGPTCRVWLVLKLSLRMRHDGALHHHKHHHWKCQTRVSNKLSLNISSEATIGTIFNRGLRAS